MKTIATLLFFLFTTSAFAQKTSWDTFDFMLGTKVGMTLTQADSAIKANAPKVIRYPIKPDDTYISYTRGLYNSFPAEDISVFFSENALNRFNVSFKTKSLKKDWAAIKKV